MSSDFENGTRKTIDITVRAEQMTADVLKNALEEFMKGNVEKKGLKPYGQLAKTAKLDSIEVSEQNIGDFLKTARKYDLDFALKTDRSTEPPTFHVFFSAAKTEDFKKAFKEYVGRMQTAKRGEITKEQRGRETARASQRNKQMHRERTRENSR